MVRFEPPDIFGVPPSEQAIQEPGKSDILESLTAPTSSFATTELASEVLGSGLSSTPPAPFQSLPLLNSFGEHLIMSIFLLPYTAEGVS